MTMRVSLSKILLPVDFSKKSIEAARYATEVAKAFGARITVLHVMTQHYGFDMPGFENDELTRFLREDEDKARKQMDTLLKQGFRDLHVKRVLVKVIPPNRSSATLIRINSI